MNSNVFIKNRNKLFKLMENNSILILFAGNAPRKSGDETYTFTPNRNFYYLTGVDEENDVVVLTKFNQKEATYIYINQYDEYKAKWVGRSYFDSEIKNMSGISNISYLDSFNDELHSFINYYGVNKIYFDLERQSYNELETISQIKAKEFKNKYPNLVVEDAYPLIASLRMVKENEEIETMRKAIEITNQGILNLLSNARPNVKEFVIESHFDQKIKELGASDFAFKTIAAAGENACVLHYHQNNTNTKDGDLILFDLGAEYEYYKSDITRTFPVNGKFSDKQKLVYNIVLKGQELVFSCAKPGVTTRELNNILIQYYAKELKKIGLIEKDEEVRKYYFHGVSHHLGLDTHDACVYNTKLVPGCVITVEPGLYIPEWNIGIRIEDDVLITKFGCENLSSQIIKTVEEIEEYMAKHNKFNNK